MTPMLCWRATCHFLQYFEKAAKGVARPKQVANLKCWNEFAKCVEGSGAGNLEMSGCSRGAEWVDWAD